MTTVSSSLPARLRPNQGGGLGLRKALFAGTKPFRRPNGEVVPGSIAEAGYIRLGGVDQWLMVRGVSLDNPPLILLYGGPGLSETGFFRSLNSILEQAFTVVYWDQRGSGKSFDPQIPRSSMTLEQFITDLDELVDAVRRLTGKDRVTIFGHSWGSALGTLYAARFPAKVALYAGSGQIGDWPAGEAASYAIALREAERRRNSKALAELREIGPPPYGADGVMTERMWLARFDGQMTPRALWKTARIFLAAPEASVLDLRRTLRGFKFSLDSMWDEVSKLNLLKLTPELRMPVVLLLGRNDHWVPPETSVSFFDALVAPTKKLVWFEASGHEPFADEPAKFNAMMLSVVRPLLS